MLFCGLLYQISKFPDFAAKVGHHFFRRSTFFFGPDRFFSVLLQQIGALTWKHRDTLENHIVWKSHIDLIYQIRNMIGQGQVVVDLRYLTHFARQVLYYPWSSFCLSYCAGEVGPVLIIAKPCKIGQRFKPMFQANPNWFLFWTNLDVYFFDSFPTARNVFCNHFHVVLSLSSFSTRQIVGLQFPNDS